VKLRVLEVPKYPIIGYGQFLSPQNTAFLNSRILNGIRAMSEVFRISSWTILVLALMASFWLSMPQIANAEGPDAPPRLSFDLVPYIWAPTFNTTVGRGTMQQTVSSTPGDYLSKLNFITMVAGSMRYGRFSLSTDQGDSGKTGEEADGSISADLKMLDSPCQGGRDRL
jgi:hypothetical protein